MVAVFDGLLKIGTGAGVGARRYARQTQPMCNTLERVGNMYQKHIKQYVAAKRGKVGNKLRSSRRIVTTARDRYLKALKAWRKALEDEAQNLANKR